MNFADALEMNLNVTKTENGAKAFDSTLGANLDVFFGAGGIRASRNRSKEQEDMVITFKKALMESRELAVRNLINIRNFRIGGMGERDLFRKLYLALDKETQLGLIPIVPIIGRWDDLQWVFNNTSDEKVKNDIARFIAEQLNKDLSATQPSLLAKWLPSDKGSRATKEDKDYIKALGFKYTRDYRKVLSRLRPKLDLIETSLTLKKYDDINLEKIPSRAFNMYHKALWNHKPKEMELLTQKVKNGEATIKMSGVTPDEVVEKLMSYRCDQTSIATAEAQWASYSKDKEVTDDVLVLADVSGSMSGKPMSVSIALAIYFSERAKGGFRNKFLTFSEQPTLISLSDNMTLKEKVRVVKNSPWGYNTNVRKAFNVILDTALKAGMSQDDLPKTLVIISDMQFDEADDGHTNFQQAKIDFENKGYKLPNVVFWNVAGDSNVPITANEKGVSLVSGFTPSVMNAISELKTENFTPKAIMYKQLYSEGINKIISMLNF